MANTGKLWKRHNALNGEHIWQGHKYIADIVTDTDNPEWNRDVNEIAKSAILMHNDPKYRAAEDLYEELKKADGLICHLCKMCMEETLDCDSCDDRKLRLKVLAKAGEISREGSNPATPTK